jgi:hypothetical protein
MRLRLRLVSTQVGGVGKAPTFFSCVRAGLGGLVLVLTCVRGQRELAADRWAYLFFRRRDGVGGVVLRRSSKY